MDVRRDRFALCARGGGGVFSVKYGAMAVDTGQVFAAMPFPALTNGLPTVYLSPDRYKDLDQKCDSCSYIHHWSMGYHWATAPKYHCCFAGYWLLLRQLILLLCQTLLLYQLLLLFLLLCQPLLLCQLLLCFVSRQAGSDANVVAHGAGGWILDSKGGHPTAQRGVLPSYMSADPCLHL